MEEEGEVSNQDIAMPKQERDQQLSDEQNYRETVGGVGSFIRVPEFESAASSQDNNLFARPRTQPTGKVSVTLQSDEWLSRKMEKPNITLIVTHSPDTSGLTRDPFVKLPRTQKCYDVY